MIYRFVVACLHNDGHVLQLWSETVAVHRRMIHDGHLITGDECGPNFLVFVLRLSENPGKNLDQEIDPTENRTQARCVRSYDVTPVVCIYRFKKVLGLIHYFCLSPSLSAIYPPQCRTLTPPGTYNSHASGSDACRGCTDFGPEQ